MSGEQRGRSGREWVEHVEETLPGAHTPKLRLDWPRPSEADAGPAEYRTLHEEDAQRVRERVHADLLVFPPDLQVSVHDGIVVLDGRASSPQERKRIEALAREVVGHAIVENRMIVEGG